MGYILKWDSNGGIIAVYSGIIKRCNGGIMVGFHVHYSPTISPQRHPPTCRARPCWVAAWGWWHWPRVLRILRVSGGPGGRGVCW